MRKKLIELLCTCSCHGHGESLGSCPDRKYGMCGEVADLSYCVIQNLASHLIANGVTIQEWIPLSEQKPCRDDLVIVFFEGMRDTPAQTQIMYGWCIGGSATHWMPLPEPPKED